MKKTIKTISSLLAASLMFLTVTGVQARTPAGKTDEFHGHWFITVQGGIGQPAVVAPVPVTVPEEKPAPEDDGQASAPAAPAPVPTPVEEAAPEQEETQVSEFKSEKRDVFFRIGRYELRESEMAKLEELAAIARENPGTVVEVTGYADPQTGSAKRNMYLSQKRAEAVAGWLETAGISKTRIKISYKGSTESPYDTPEKNRVAVCIVK